MNSQFVNIAILVAVIAVVLATIALARGRTRSNSRGGASSRSSGPANLHYVCAGCSQQFTHTRRTLGAWEKGTRRFFCSPCHSQWRDKQPSREKADLQRSSGHRGTSDAGAAIASTRTDQRPSRTSVVPARSGCFTVIAIAVLVPIAVWATARFS